MLLQEFQALVRLRLLPIEQEANTKFLHSLDARVFHSLYLICNVRGHHFRNLQCTTEEIKRSRLDQQSASKYQSVQHVENYGLCEYQRK